MGKDFVDDDLLLSRKGSPRFSLGLDNARRDGFIPSSKDPPSKPLDDLELTSLAGRSKSRKGGDTSAEAIAELAELENRKAEMEEERQLLEELYEKQKAFEEGRTALQEIFAQGETSAARAEDALAQRARMLQEARACLQQHRIRLESIREEDWEGAQMIDELDAAIDFLTTARRECVEAMDSLDACAVDRSGGSRRKARAASGMAVDGFGGTLKQGLAFCLPLMLFLLLLTVAAMVFFLKYA